MCVCMIVSDICTALYSRLFASLVLGVFRCASSVEQVLCVCLALSECCVCAWRRGIAAACMRASAASTHLQAGVCASNDIGSAASDGGGGIRLHQQRLRCLGNEAIDVAAKVTAGGAWDRL
jgi:hypothetical protein